MCVCVCVCLRGVERVSFRSKKRAEEGGIRKGVGGRCQSLLELRDI